MQNEMSQQVVKRFFEALHELINRDIIKGRQTFTRRYGINRWNMITVEREPSRDMFQMAWLTHIVNDYGVSAQWLLTGKGDMFVK